MRPPTKGTDQAAWMYELGEQWRRQGQNQEAVGCYRQALRLRPKWPEAHLALGHTLLLAGDFTHGLEEMEWRWRLPGVVLEQFPQPLWKGEPLAGRRLLVWAEQGFGDTIQFVRFAAQVKRLGASVALECQPALARLLETAPGVDAVVPFGAPLPPFDYHAPLQRLPWLLRTTLQTIPVGTPYLTAGAALVERWRARLAGCGGIKAGLAWSGNPKQVSNRSRSLDPALLAPLLAVPGVSWFALQKEGGEVGLGADLGPELSDFAETAAVLANLDLLITVDTAVAHLAGALGHPVWTLLSVPADYRWLIGREDSPWYPSMRLFRQGRAGDWAPVIERVERALLELLGQ